MESQQFSSVEDLVDDIFADDNDAASEIKNEIRSQKLATILHSMRCRAGISQQEMAERLGCTQSRVSKLEHSDTSRITVRDLEDYSRNLGINLIIRFQENMTAAEHVKHHFSQIKRHLDHLRELAKDDPEIAKGVDQFYNEWFLNTLKHFHEGKIELSKSKGRTGEASFEILGPEETEEELGLAELSQ